MPYFQPHCQRLTAILTVALLLQIFIPTRGLAQDVSFQTPYVTRAEAAMILLRVRLRTSIPYIGGDGRFPDVQEGTWYERYVVLAERYGVLQTQALTGRLRPDDAVTRGEFLKMLAATFGLRLNLPYLYRDVPATSWHAPYAGVAQMYNVFRNDRDKSQLSPDSPLTHEETIMAIFYLGRQLTAADLPSLESQEIAAREKREQLQFFDRISVQQGEVTHFQSVGPIVFLPPPPRPSYEDPVKVPELRRAIIELVNKERTIVGLQPLRSNSYLEGSAQRYADKMAEENFFGHVDPQGKTLSQRVEDSGFYQTYNAAPCFCVERFLVGENLARGQRTPEEAIGAWLRSDSHRRAILTAEFTDIGIGINAGIWVQHFGGRKTP